MFIAKKDVIESCSNVQMCSGHEADCEAAFNAMKEMFEHEESEAALLVDAANAFNNVNRQGLLHNIKILCPVLACYVNNCYCIPARLIYNRREGAKIERRYDPRRSGRDGYICHRYNTTVRDDVEFNYDRPQQNGCICGRSYSGWEIRIIKKMVGQIIGTRSQVWI